MPGSPRGRRHGALEPAPRHPHARLDGLEVTRLLAGPEVSSPLRVVVTTFDLDEYVHTALHHGACRLLLKRSGPRLLVEAVREAVARATAISPQVTVRLLRHLDPSTAAPARPSGAALTNREVEIARILAESRTNAEIAADLYLAPGTVKNHVAAIHRSSARANRCGDRRLGMGEGPAPRSRWRHVTR